MEIPRSAREVDVGAIEVVDWALPAVTLRVECGKGTYIRVLAEDLGAALGTCAHLAALRRTGSGAFRLDDAVTLERLEAMDEPAARDALLLPVDAPVASLPALVVDAVSAAALMQGRTRMLPPARRGATAASTPQSGFSASSPPRTACCARSASPARIERARPPQKKNAATRGIFRGR